MGNIFSPPAALYNRIDEEQPLAAAPAETNGAEPQARGTGRGGEHEDGDDANQKHDALLSPMLTRCLARRCRCRLPRDSKLACAKCCLAASCVLVLGLLIAVIVLAVANGGAQPIMHTISMLQSLPVAQDWNTYLDCLQTPKCDLCTLPKTVWMHPPLHHRVAIVAPRGTGATLLRQLIESGTRIRTGTDDCWIAHQFGVPWKNAPFKNECAGPFFFTHEVAVRFFNWAHTRMYAHYTPTHAIIVARNPFDSILSAYAFFQYCHGVHNIYCENRGASSADFSNMESWEAFAMDRAQEWIDFMNESESSALSKMTIYYEDLAQHRMPTMQAVLEFLSQAVEPLPTVSQSLSCALGDQSTATKRASSVAAKDVFSAALVERICVVVRPRWNTTKWGAACGVAPG